MGDNDRQNLNKQKVCGSSVSFKSVKVYWEQKFWELLN